VARLPTQTPMALPVEVINGKRAGAALWLAAAIHGDELNGLEIIHRALAEVDPVEMCGHVIAVPIVNVFGFIQRDRYMPDRRDLNRCFPGSKRGSLASRLAHLFMTEIVGRCTHGIDLHTASNHRTNLPQVRGDLDDPGTDEMATAFGAPITIHSEGPDGSLRRAVAERGIPVIVYEAGEPQRFNPRAIEIGVEGVLNVLGALGILPGRGERRASSVRRASSGMRSNSGMRASSPRRAGRTSWLRARRSGILRLEVGLGERVGKGEVCGTISDALGGDRVRVRSRHEGLVISHTNNPLVNRGDAIVHIARDVTPL